MSAPAGMIMSTTIVLIASVVPHPRSRASGASAWKLTISGRLRYAVPAIRPRLRCVSPVDVSQNEIQRSEDRDDVGHVHTLQQPRQDRHVAERRGPDLHAERAGRALRDHVVAHLP